MLICELLLYLERILLLTHIKSTYLESTPNISLTCSGFVLFIIEPSLYSKSYMPPISSDITLAPSFAIADIKENLVLKDLLKNIKAITFPLYCGISDGLFLKNNASFTTEFTKSTPSSSPII